MKKNFKIKNSAAKLLLLALCAQPLSLLAANADWLAIELDTISLREDPSAARMVGDKFFEDSVSAVIDFSQSIRSAISADGSKNQDRHSAVFSDKPLPADAWMKNIPKAQIITNSLALNPGQHKIRCHLEKVSSKISCNDSKKTVIQSASTTSQPVIAFYNKTISDQLARQSKLPSKNSTAIVQEKVLSSPSGEDIVLVEKNEGLVGVVGDLIEFEAPLMARRVSLSPKMKDREWSLFVRDNAAINWDETSKRLTALKAGDSELFVVTPGRISIIKLHVKGAQAVSTSLVAAAKSQKNSGFEVSSSLASLDGLDYAATRGSWSGSHGGISSTAPDLAVSDEVAQLGHSGVSSSSAFARAKSKVSFVPVTIKVIDDRSLPGGANFPLSGIRVKIAGTEFSELTNARGEIEVRDVPIGARLLLDLSDERSHIMPQMSELYVAADANTGKIPTATVIARRFASLDLAARSVGVVQDMRKSSFCGSLANGALPASGYTVSVDVAATGPFYFNHLGFADVRAGLTGYDGRFCFFNVEPGPVTVGIRAQNSSDVLSTVVGAVASRHLEERFNLADAKFLSANLAAVAAANEQLGADAVRANRHDLVESGDVYAVGSGDMMVPLDDGRLTTPSPVLPFKGRVLTVTSSTDFETTVQTLSSDGANVGQVLKMVPNGFVNDMSYFAHTTHSPDLGSVVVEHGHLGGQGQQSVKMRLIDPFGRDAGDGWYFADQPVSKAVFFNVVPGIYSLIIETDTGHWIAADTVIVYSESVSFAKTGNNVERRVIPRASTSVE
jgi:hypothetical protein